MGDLSKHFSRHEMACKCGCGFDSIDVQTLLLAEEVREYVGMPIIPTSVCRCEQHNREVGGEEYSYHMQARAMDLPVPNPLGVFVWLSEKYGGRYGFGCYMRKGFVHIDTRTHGPARWYG
ncbi:MAG: D-Ala-D-Ala carboxypeptidase family metallohydrolase [bacterium]